MYAPKTYLELSHVHKNFNPGLKRSYSHEVVCRSTQLLSLPTDRVPRSYLFQTIKML